jgi:hypothetical protein
VAWGNPSGGRGVYFDYLYWLSPDRTDALGPDGDQMAACAGTGHLMGPKPTDTSVLNR